MYISNSKSTLKNINRSVRLHYSSSARMLRARVTLSIAESDFEYTRGWNGVTEMKYRYDMSNMIFYIVPYPCPSPHVLATENIHKIIFIVKCSQTR